MDYTTALESLFNEEDRVAPAPSLGEPIDYTGALKTLFSEEDAGHEPESENLFTTAGKGLVHGALGLGESLGIGTQWLGNRLGSETITDIGETASKYYGEKAEKYSPPKSIENKTVWDNPELLTNGSWWAYNVADMVPSFAATIGASVLTGGAAAEAKTIQIAGKVIEFTPKVIRGLASLAGGIVGGGLEGSQTYKAVLAQGGSEEEAAISAELMGAGSAALNALGISKVLEKAGGSFRARVLQKLGAGAWEGLTEGAEEPWEVVSKLTARYVSGEELPNDIKEQFVQSLKDAITVAPIAAVTGLGGAILSGSEKDTKKQKNIPPVDELLSSPPLDSMREKFAKGEFTPQELETAKAIWSDDTDFVAGIDEILNQPAKPVTQKKAEPVDVVLKTPTDQLAREQNQKQINIEAAKEKYGIAPTQVEVPLAMESPRKTPSPVPSAGTSETPGQIPIVEAPDYETEAKKLGIIFNGMQERFNKPPLPTFTDNETNSSFLVKPEETIEGALQRTREGYKVPVTTSPEVSTDVKEIGLSPDIQTALQKSTPISVKESVKTKVKTKETLTSKLDSGEIPEDTPVRLTTIDELRGMIESGELYIGEDFEGRAGISAQTIRKESPIVAYGANDKISAAIIFPKESIEETGEAVNEVKMNPRTNLNELRFVIGGYPELLTFEQIKDLYKKTPNVLAEAPTVAGKQLWEILLAKSDKRTASSREKAKQFEKEPYKSLSDKYDEVQKRIDDYEDTLPKDITTEESMSDDKLSDLYAERDIYGIAAGNKMYKSAYDIIEKNLKDIAVTDNIYTGTKNILSEVYSLYPEKSFSFDYTGEALSNPKSIKDLTLKISQLILSKESPAADYWMTMESSSSGLTESGKRNILNKAKKIAEKIHTEISNALTTTPPTVQGKPDLKPAAKAEVVGKQPWEMTKTEFSDTMFDKKNPSHITPRPELFSGWTQEEIANFANKYKPEHNSRLHETFIKKAIDEGKSIPPEVLKDYPDLAKKAPPEVAKPSVQISEDIKGNKIEQIFIREPNKSELTNPSSIRNFAKIPDKEGWEKVYKHSGEQGKGYYYIRPLEKSILAGEARKYGSAEEFVEAIKHDVGGVGKDKEYTPFKRLIETNVNNTPLTNFGFKPDDKVTIYRGVDNASQKDIVAGDYITTSPELAGSYTGGKVISKEVPASSVRFSSEDGITVNNFKEGFNKAHIEGVYNPNPLISESQLTDIYNQAKGIKAESVEATLTPASVGKAASPEAPTSDISAKEGLGRAEIGEVKGVEGETGKKDEIKVEGGKEKTVSVDMTKKVEATLKPKEQKEYLLAEIDKAIDAHFNETLEGNQDRIKAMKNGEISFFPQSDTIYTFEVPGDGEFKVTGGNLQKFQKRAQKFPTSISRKGLVETGGKINYTAVEKWLDKITGKPENLKTSDIPKLLTEVEKRGQREAESKQGRSTFQDHYINWLLSKNISEKVVDYLKKPENRFIELAETESEGEKYSVGTEKGEKYDALYMVKKRGETKYLDKKIEEEQIKKVFSKKGFSGVGTVSLLPRNTELRKKINEITEEFGVTTEFWRADKGNIRDINGIMVSSNPNKIYINEQADEPLLFVAGHELIHTIRFRYPDLHAFLLESFKDNTINFSKYIADLEVDVPKGIKIELVESEMLDELIGDFTGQQLGKKDFYQKLYSKNPTLATRLFNLIKSILKYFKQATITHNAEKYVSNIDKAQNIVAEVLNEVAKRQDVATIGETDKTLFSLASSEAKKETEKARRDYLKQHFPEMAENLNDITNESDTVTDVLAAKKAIRWTKNGKKDLNIFDTTLSTAEFYSEKDPTYKRYMEVIFNASTKFYEMQNQILGTFQDNSKVLKKEDKQFGTKRYNRLGDYLDSTDRFISGYSVQEIESPLGTSYGVYGKPVIGMAKNLAQAAKMIEGNKDALVAPSGKEYMVLGKRELLTKFKTEQEAVDSMIDYEVEDYVKAHRDVSDAEIDTMRDVRKATNEQFNLLFEQMRKLIADTKIKNEKELTVTVGMETKEDGTVVPIKKDLSWVMAEMGNLRGSYMPRIRARGKYVLIAKKDENDKFREHFDVPATEEGSIASMVTKHVIPMQRRAEELKRQGYTVTYEKSKVMPETLFESAKLVAATDAMIKAGVEGLPESKASQDLKAELGNLLSESISNIFQARGFRSQMIKRSGEVGDAVWKGYETDLDKRIVGSANSVAAGIAKRDKALGMMLTIMGKDISWDAFREDNPKATYKDYEKMVNERRIDPIEQPTMYADIMDHAKEVLRNDEAIDRVVGVAKGVASMWFLAGRVSSAAVNGTNMAILVPAIMHGIGKIPYHKTYGLIGSSMKTYINFRFGKEVSESNKRVLTEIHNRGWDAPLFNQDAYEALLNKTQGGWNSAISKGMWMFGKVEELNRGSTILAAYNGLTGSFEDRLAKAKHISDRAHGIYSKATRPAITRGTGLLPAIARSAVTFTKYSHTYLLDLLQLAKDEKSAKAVAHVLLAPAIIGGLGASVLTPVIAGIANALGFGGDDPEEEWYKYAEEEYGSGNWLRHGLVGLGGYGVNLKGSLSIGLKSFNSLESILGAPYAVPSNIVKGIGLAAKGEFSKGLEKALPMVLAVPMRGIREATKGVTTGSNVPVFYGQKPVIGTPLEAMWSFFAFNPSRTSAIKEELWKERNVEKVFSDRKSDIYRKYRHMWSEGIMAEKLGELVKEREVFNEDVEKIKESGYFGVTPITDKSLKAQRAKMLKPPKKEKERAAYMDEDFEFEPTPFKPIKLTGGLKGINLRKAIQLTK